MGIRPEDIARAVAGGNKVLQQLQRVCPKQNEYTPLRPLPNPKPQCNQTPALDSPVQRKAKGDDRIVVRFVGRRIQPLDPDNFSAGCKDLLDGLRHSGLIPGDRPDQIILVTEQIKVHHKWQEFTEIELLG